VDGVIGVGEEVAGSGMARAGRRVEARVRGGGNGRVAQRRGERGGEVTTTP
jgi:hypothetical protein